VVAGGGSVSSFFCVQPGIDQPEHALNSSLSTDKTSPSQRRPTFLTLDQGTPARGPPCHTPPQARGCSAAALPLSCRHPPRAGSSRGRAKDWASLGGLQALEQCDQARSTPRRERPAASPTSGDHPCSGIAARGTAGPAIDLAGRPQPPASCTPGRSGNATLEPFGAGLARPAACGCPILTAPATENELMMGVQIRLWRRSDACVISVIRFPFTLLRQICSASV